LASARSRAVATLPPRSARRSPGALAPYADARDPGLDPDVDAIWVLIGTSGTSKARKFAAIGVINWCLEFAQRLPQIRSVVVVSTGTRPHLRRANHRPEPTNPRTPSPMPTLAAASTRTCQRRERAIEPALTPRASDYGTCDMG
jgi:hypothetical protein